MEKNNRQKIESLILDSRVEEKNKGVFFDMIKSFTDNEVDEFYGFLEKDIISFKILEKILELKRKAFSKKDEDFFGEVLKKEIKILKDLNAS